MLQFNSYQLEPYVGLITSGPRKGQACALKEMSYPLQQLQKYPQLKGMISMEMYALHRLAPHPNIVDIWMTSQGNTESNTTVYVLMEAIEGRTLNQCLALVSSNTPLVSKIVKGIAYGLEHLHSRRPEAMLHRDLKLENVILTEKHHVPKIIDFGSSVAMDSSKTKTFIDYAGTQAYFSPERFTPEDEESGSGTGPSGPGDDVWALGIIACELALGRRMTSIIGAFPAATFMGSPTRLTNLIVRVKEADAALGRAVEAALQIDRKMRASAAQLAQML